MKYYRDMLARNKGFCNHKEYLDHLAKEKGFNNYKEYIDHRITERGFSSRKDYYDHLAKQKGFKNQQDELLCKINKKGFETLKEYRSHLFMKETGYYYIDSITRLNKWANNKGFVNYKDYLNIITIGRGLSGIPNIICDDRSDKHFIGHMGEYVVSKIYKNIRPMFFTNYGFDFLCEMGDKIEVKSSLLHSNNKFTFHIDYNNTADYIIMIGFDNVLDLNPLHFWIVKKGEKISIKNRVKNRINKMTYEISINNIKILSIGNNKDEMANFLKYEKEDKLEELKNICLEYNKDSGIYNDFLTKNYIIRTCLGIKLSNEELDILKIFKDKQKKRVWDSKIPIFPKEEGNK